MLEAVSESHALIEKVGIYTLQHETKGQRESFDLAQGFLWGRRSQASPLHAVACLAVMLACPLLITLFWITIEHYRSSLSFTLAHILIEGPFMFFLGHWPQFSAKATLGYASWVAFQAGLYYYLPCQLSTGQLTPGGTCLCWNFLSSSSLAFALKLYLASALHVSYVLRMKQSVFVNMGERKLWRLGTSSLRY